MFGFMVRRGYLKNGRRLELGCGFRFFRFQVAFIHLWQAT